MSEICLLISIQQQHKDQKTNLAVPPLPSSLVDMATGFFLGLYLMTSPVPDTLVLVLGVDLTELEDVVDESELEAPICKTSDGILSERCAACARANDAAVSSFFFVPRELEEELLTGPAPDDLAPSSPM